MTQRPAEGTSHFANAVLLWRAEAKHHTNTIPEGQQEGRPSTSTSPTSVFDSLLNHCTTVILFYLGFCIMRETTGLGQSKIFSVTSSNVAIQKKELLFLIFVKVFVLYTRKTNDPSLMRRAKAVLYECTRCNRQGHPAYTPLMDVVKRRLYEAPGLFHFARAQHSLYVYCGSRGIQIS